MNSTPNTILLGLHGELDAYYEALLAVDIDLDINEVVAKILSALTYRNDHPDWHLTQVMEDVICAFEGPDREVVQKALQRLIRAIYGRIAPLDLYDAQGHFTHGKFGWHNDDLVIARTLPEGGFSQVYDESSSFYD